MIRDFHFDTVQNDTYGYSWATVPGRSPWVDTCSIVPVALENKRSTRPTLDPPRMPNGFGENDLPTGIALMGPAFSEDLLVRIGNVYQG